MARYFFLRHEGQPAHPGTESDDHSVFTAALLKHMGEEGLELGQKNHQGNPQQLVEALKELAPSVQVQAGALCLRSRPGRGLLFQTAAAIPVILLVTAQSSKYCNQRWLCPLVYLSNFSHYRQTQLYKLRKTKNDK